MELEKIAEEVIAIVAKHLNVPNKPPPQVPQPEQSPPESFTAATSSHRSPKTTANPFLFPHAESTVLPDPSRFFAPHLLSNPLPTNSFFQNFVLENGDQPEYIHPYLIKSSQSSLTLCYPSQSRSPESIYQIFNADITVSALNNPNPNADHVVSSFSDLGLTLDLPSSNLRFFLVRGSPYLTCEVERNVAILISTVHAILDCSSNESLTKHTIKLSNNQTWILYTSSPIYMNHNQSAISTSKFVGGFRIALLPCSNPKCEGILDRFSFYYPIAGKADFTKPFCLEYKWHKRCLGFKWERKGPRDLLMLAHPLHCRLLSDTDDSTFAILEDFKYNSIDGDLVGVVGDSWVLKTDPISVTWHSIKGISEESFVEIISALNKDVRALDSANMHTESYYYGKLIAKAARLALIAEEVCHLDVIPTIQRFLKDAIQPWLDGTFEENGFLYDSKWGGLVTKLGLTGTCIDFGFGIFNDHHCQIGYFIYAIAVLSKIDATWCRKYRGHAYSLLADFMNLSRQKDSNYPRLRCFDLWKLHSWDGGLTEIADGRYQLSTSEAVNAYYSAALMGLAYGDTHLVAVGSTLCALEIQSAQTWRHVRQDGNLYAKEFTKANRVLDYLCANKRASLPSSSMECKLLFQVWPILPITEVLFSDVEFVKQLVQWALPSFESRGWLGFIQALKGIYDKAGALEELRKLSRYDFGESLTNLLWWIHSRADDVEAYDDKEGKFCMFRHYCL